MAAITVSQVTSIVNENNPIHIDFLNGETPVVSSLDVARHFQRRHSHILRDIDRLRSILPKSFREPNFGLTFNEIPGPNGATRKEKAYFLTRDAFSLLVMGMTGKAAILWKLRYIEAFNALEAAALENRAELARESGYLQGLDEGRASALPELKAAEEKAQRETARLFWKLGPARKRRLRSAVRYRNMGLGIHAIAKLLDVSSREISALLKAADALELLPEKPALPVQGSLLEVGA